MKSERRHELESNALELLVVKYLKAIKPYTNMILGVVILLLVAWIGYGLWSSNSQKQKEESTQSLVTTLDQIGNRQIQLQMDMMNAYQKGDPNLATILARRPANRAQALEDLDTMANKYPETTPGAAAALMAADDRFLMASEELFSDKLAAEDKLNLAQQNYAFVLKNATSPIFKQRAVYGLARVAEARSDIDTALKHYKEVVAKWPDCFVADDCKSRIADLERPETREFFALFKKFAPEPTTNTSLPSGNQPAVDYTEELPDNPTMPATVSGTGEEGTADAVSAPATVDTTDETTTEAPATADTAVEDTTPAPVGETTVVAPAVVGTGE